MMIRHFHVLYEYLFHQLFRKHPSIFQPVNDLVPVFNVYEEILSSYILDGRYFQFQLPLVSLPRGFVYPSLEREQSIFQFIIYFNPFLLYIL